MKLNSNAPTAPTVIDPSDILTVSEVAGRLKVPDSWVYEKTRTRCGTPPASNAGRQIPQIFLARNFEVVNRAEREMKAHEHVPRGHLSKCMKLPRVEAIGSKLFVTGRRCTLDRQYDIERPKLVDGGWTVWLDVQFKGIGSQRCEVRPYPNFTALPLREDARTLRDQIQIMLAQRSALIYVPVSLPTYPSKRYIATHPPLFPFTNKEWAAIPINPADFAGTWKMPRSMPQMFPRKEKTMRTNETSTRNS
jgi:hypothetical protein